MMRFLSSAATRDWTGIDPGASAAKAAAIRWVRGRPAVTRVAFRPTADSSRQAALQALA